MAATSRSHAPMRGALALAPALLVAAFAACGGAPSEAKSPAGGAPTEAPSAAPMTDGGAPAPSASSAAAPSPAPGGAFAGPMKPIVASAMEADLKALGLDPKNLPPLNKLEPDKLRKVMRTFTKAMGVKCSDCHNEGDFAAPTPMKKIATYNWDEFVRKLSMDDGSLVYCDSCHQGRKQLLDRHDKKALSDWMDKNFVAKVKRKDGKEHNCETCHGDPFDGAIYAKLSK